MKRFLVAVLTLALMGSGAAHAHQPVVLLSSDTTAAKGPLLVDGSISFAVRASFTKSGERRAFRALFKQGDTLNLQYLIVDKKPESALKTSVLPTVVATAPDGSKITMKINERTKFYEPYGKTNYLYLARVSTPAKAGVYSIVITAKGKAAITLAVGEKEIAGQVVRGPVPVVSASATPSASAATPTPSPTVAAPTPKPIVASPSPTPTVAAFTMTQVKANNTAKSCWAVVDGDVYDLTTWINAHPGGSSAILFLCGTDATNAFRAQHQMQQKPTNRLDSFLLGPLKR